MLKGLNRPFRYFGDSSFKVLNINFNLLLFPSDASGLPRRAVALEYQLDLVIILMARFCSFCNMSANSLLRRASHTGQQ